MNSFILLIGIAVIVYILIMPVINRMVDNSGDLDLNHEKRLTDRK